MNTIKQTNKDMMGRVALVRCDDYEDTRVYDAVSRGLELLGGMERFVQMGENIPAAVIRWATVQTEGAFYFERVPPGTYRLKGKK